MNLIPAILTIWIPKQGYVEQGKFCLVNGKPYFVANMTQRKWWRIFGGYAIAKRVLESLPKGTSIIYKRTDLDAFYESRKTTFYKKGVAVKYGGHSQIVLPIKNWKFHQGKFEGEVFSLPAKDLNTWLRSAGATKTNQSLGGVDACQTVSGRSYKTFNFYDLKKVFEKRFAS